MQFNPREFLHSQREKLHTRFVKGWKSQALFEFITFGVKQAWACLFGALMLAILFLTFLFYPEDAVLPRYDFVTLAAITIQVSLLLLRLETWKKLALFLSSMLSAR